MIATHVNLEVFVVWKGDTLYTLTPGLPFRLDLHIITSTATRFTVEFGHCSLHRCQKWFSLTPTLDLNSFCFRSRLEHRMPTLALAYTYFSDIRVVFQHLPRIEAPLFFLDATHVCSNLLPLFYDRWKDPSLLSFVFSTDFLFESRGMCLVSAIFNFCLRNLWVILRL